MSRHFFKNEKQNWKLFHLISQMCSDLFSPFFKSALKEFIGLRENEGTIKLKIT